MRSHPNKAVQTTAASAASIRVGFNFIIPFISRRCLRTAVPDLWRSTSLTHLLIFLSSYCTGVGGFVNGCRSRSHHFSKPVAGQPSRSVVVVVLFFEPNIHCGV